MAGRLRVRDPEALAAIAEAERIVRGHKRHRRRQAVGRALRLFWHAADDCFSYCASLAAWQAWML
ncbi:MAG TPA: hypothetical protein VFS62_09305 [Chloroflexota bacterium]|jgi:hypothetical protein|nr:hypothetical protein [Chloroflexota bacterium]